MEVITDSTRIIDLTVGQFMRLIEQTLTPVSALPPPVLPDRKLVYGIEGIAQLFGCSRTTASRIKASGRIDEAITQNGRVIVVDAEKALELFNEK